MVTKRLIAGSLFCATLAIATACDTKGIGWGDPNSIIAVMSEDQWFAVSDDLYETLEQTATTARNEKKFTVTYQEPYAEFWMNLRRFRQMLVIGSRSEPWVQEVLDDAREPITEDGIHQIYNVWATGQTVTLVLLPEAWGQSDLQPYLADVHTLLDGQYRSYAVNRMYYSGVDSALADTLHTEQGFLLFFPKVYSWNQVADSVFVFRNDNPDPSELIKEIVVTWLSPAPASVSVDEMLEWRARLVEDYYSHPQDLVADGMIEESFDFHGNEALQIQAQWRNPPESWWPAGGPLITRVITCDSQDRTYLIDAWLYAPGEEKYYFMIGLETILASFRCDS